MTALLLEPGQTEFLEEWETTLDQLLSGIWEGLRAAGVQACPLCEGRLLPIRDASGAITSGRCAECSTELK